MSTEHPLSRRDLLKTAALGIGGAALSGTAAEAAAQGGVTRLVAQPAHEKLVITLSPSGAGSLLPQRGPRDVRAHAAEALEGINAGAAIVHLRGASKNVAQKPHQNLINLPDMEDWRQLTEAVRSKSSVIINYGASAMTPDVRKQLITTLKPDAGSFLVGHHYGGLTLLPDIQKQFAVDHLAAGVLPEVEVFHTGDVANFNDLVAQGLLKPPYCVTVFLDYSRYYKVPATVQQLEAMVALLPPNTHWTICVRGPKHLEMAAIAITMGGHVRTGLENDVELSPGRPAKTQGECVERIVQLARSLGREIATIAEARQQLALPRKPEIVKS